jgi:O-antigen/teichoic acid export membrane protein
VGSFTSTKELSQQLRSPLYRNAFYLMINWVIIGVVGLIFWILAARFYSAESVGFASATISAMTLLALLSSVGLDYGIIRFLPGSGKDSNDMINSCLTISVLASLIVASIFIAGLGFWSPALLFLKQNTLFLGAFIVFTAGTTLLTFLSLTFVAERRAGFTLAQSAIFNVLRLLLIVPLSVFFASFGIFASWGIGTMVAIGTSVLIWLPQIQAGYRPFPMINKSAVNKLMPFSLANYVATLLWSTPNLILPIIVINLVGAEANAYFYIAWAIANILLSISRGTTMSLFAEGSYEERRIGQHAGRSLALAYTLVIPAIVLIWFIGDKFLLIFGKAYAEYATQLLRILALSLIPSSLNFTYFGIKRVKMEMKSVISLSAFIAIATLILSWILLPRIGISAVGIAWLSSHAAVALVITINLILRRMAAK